MLHSAGFSGEQPEGLAADRDCVRGVDLNARDLLCRGTGCRKELLRMGRVLHSRVLIVTRSVTLGLLVAAAGIGGSDVSLAALTGSRFGVTLVWAIVVGAVIKFVLNEGVARWQIATGETFLRGACRRLGPAAWVVFLVYLLPWTLAVGAALMSACAGVSGAMIGAWQGWPPGEAAPTGLRVGLALLHSLVAAGLVLGGGYRAFKHVMSVLTVTMVLLVLVAAALTRPDVGALLSALLLPRLPADEPNGIRWTIALIGGIGGTVTMLAYGYWVREEEPEAAGGAGASGDERGAALSHRADLAVAYTFTAVFGVALTVVCANVPVRASGADLFSAVATRLTETIGPAAGWVYLAGAWCAVWACMLGVWQFIPLLFADFVSVTGSKRERSGGDAPPPPAIASLARTTTYRVYLLALATVPIAGVWHDFADVQRAFGVLGAMFIPLLAAALLVMNNRRDLMGRHANGRLANTALVVALLMAAAALAAEAARLFGG